MKKPKTKFKVRVTTPVLTNFSMSNSYKPKFGDRPWICRAEIVNLFGLKSIPKRIRLTGTTVKPKRLDGVVEVLLVRQELDTIGGVEVWIKGENDGEWDRLYSALAERALRLNIKTKPTPVWIKLKKL